MDSVTAAERPDTTATPRRVQALALLAIVGVCAALTGRLLTTFFVYDDAKVLADAEALSGGLRLFCLWQADGACLLDRLLFAAIFAGLGSSPLFYHLPPLLFHLGNVVLIFLLGRRLAERLHDPFFVAIFGALTFAFSFAFHLPPLRAPLLRETLVSFLYLLTCYAYLSRGRWAGPAAAAALFGALLAGGSPLFVLVLPLLDRTRATPAGRAWTRLLPPFLAGLIFLLFSGRWLGAPTSALPQGKLDFIPNFFLFARELFLSVLGGTTHPLLYRSTPQIFFLFLALGAFTLYASLSLTRPRTREPALLSLGIVLAAAQILAALPAALSVGSADLPSDPFLLFSALYVPGPFFSLFWAAALYQLRPPFPSLLQRRLFSFYIVVFFAASTYYASVIQNEIRLRAEENRYLIASISQAPDARRAKRIVLLSIPSKTLKAHQPYLQDYTSLLLGLENVPVVWNPPADTLQAEDLILEFRQGRGLSTRLVPAGEGKL